MITLLHTFLLLVLAFTDHCMGCLELSAVVEPKSPGPGMMKPVASEAKAKMPTIVRPPCPWTPLSTGSPWTPPMKRGLDPTVDPPSD